MISKPAVSIIVPSYNERGALVPTLRSLCRTRNAMAISSELLVIATQQDVRHAAKATEGELGIRIIVEESPGKFQRLRVGVEHSRGDVLLLMDADTIFSAAGCEALVRRVYYGKAEVAYGAVKRLRLRSRTPRAALLSRWADLSFEAWDCLRRNHSEHRWALPGPCYAISRKYFPETALVPILDDASVGLAAVKRGAHVFYDWSVLASTASPTKYTDWCRQKIRTRAGWLALKRIHPDLVERLHADLEICLAHIITAHPLSVRSLRLHNKLLWFLANQRSAEAVASGSWIPRRRITDSTS